MQFDLENARPKVNIQGTLVGEASSWLIFFLYHISWTNHSHDLTNRMFDLEKNGFEIIRKIPQGDLNTYPVKKWWTTIQNTIDERRKYNHLLR